MKMHFYFQWLVTCTFLLCCNQHTDVQNNKTGLISEQSSTPIVILKMDDLEYTHEAFVKNWERYVDSIRSYNLNSGLGIIIDHLKESPKSFKDSLISWHQSGDFEIWHHGWDHQRLNAPPDSTNDGEFKETPYPYQKEHLDKAQEVVKTELGITMRSFGAPYNKTDSVFSQVIRENDDIKVWLYCDDIDYPQMCLVRGPSNKLESATGVVSFDSFMTAYQANENTYLVLQGHPGKWDNQSFAAFDEVVSFLKANDHPFMLPYDYYQYVKNNE
jgi:peptidoglycan/xylan/chitin deacetylase (PgdA/CDA1 family)